MKNSSVIGEGEGSMKKRETTKGNCGPPFTSASRLWAHFSSMHIVLVFMYYSCFMFKVDSKIVYFLSFWCLRFFSKWWRFVIITQDLQLNSHITFPELELIMVNQILYFNDLRSGTQSMSRLKTASYSQFKLNLKKHNLSLYWWYSALVYNFVYPVLTSYLLLGRYPTKNDVSLCEP